MLEQHTGSAIIEPEPPVGTGDPAPFTGAALLRVAVPAEVKDGRYRRDFGSSLLNAVESRKTTVEDLGEIQDQRMSLREPAMDGVIRG
jgi:hypothetical protein